MNRLLTCGPRRRRCCPNVVFAVAFTFPLRAFATIFVVAIAVAVSLVAVDDPPLLAVRFTLVHIPVHLTVAFSSPHAAPFAAPFASASATATAAFSGR
jgi:hypothetical protein